MRSKISMGACLLLASGLASATAISICGTGFKTSCGTAQTQGSDDGNYTITGEVTQPAFVTDSSSMAFTETGGWIADGSDSTNSQWISPAADESSSQAAGTYDYTETFNLTGFNLSTVSIVGEWWVDNTGTILINGVAVTGATNGTVTGTGAFKGTPASFTINSTDAPGLGAGSNTITFAVVNNNTGTPNTTGVNVDISSATGTLQATPEPATFGIMGLGLTALGLARRRFAKR